MSLQQRRKIGRPSSDSEDLYQISFYLYIFVCVCVSFILFHIIN